MFVLLCVISLFGKSVLVTLRRAVTGTVSFRNVTCCYWLCRVCCYTVLPDCLCTPERHLYWLALAWAKKMLLQSPGASSTCKFFSAPRYMAERAWRAVHLWTASRRGNFCRCTRWRLIDKRVRERGLTCHPTHKWFILGTTFTSSVKALNDKMVCCRDGNGSWSLAITLFHPAHGTRWGRGVVVTDNPTVGLDRKKS